MGKFFHVYHPILIQAVEKWVQIPMNNNTTRWFKLHHGFSPYLADILLGKVQNTMRVFVIELTRPYI